MKKLTVDEEQVFMNVARQYREFTAVINAWRLMELERLPFATEGNLDVMRGRVQALTELQRALSLD
jgi:6-phosphogluconate dehydrogenase (decarboxylating)